MRTGFLLQYLNDAQLRSTIQGATNKSPYWTQHVNRFGVYDLNLDRSPPPIAKRATKAVDYDLQVIQDIEPEIPLP